MTLSQSFTVLFPKRPYDKYELIFLRLLASDLNWLLFCSVCTAAAGS
jgi:hypothetical protein